MLIPGRRYTFEQLAKLRNDPALAQWAAKGYVWRQELDGTLELVHHTKSHMDNEVREPRGYTDKRKLKDIFPVEPIRRRTPQERKRSLIDRWWAECRKVGTVPGMSDEQLTALFGREWTTGKSEITYADVEAMAAKMLTGAEARNEEAENKRVVRTAPSD